MENHSKEVRSYNMSKIRSTGTKPEEIVRKYLFSKGLRYRKNVKTLPGKPDIVFPKYKSVVFVNGCFWHGHQNCRYFVMPKSNTEYWENKINNNIARDKIMRTCRLLWESVCSGLEVTRGSPIEYVKKIIMKLYVWKIS